MTGLLIVAALAGLVILWALGQRPSAARVTQGRERVRQRQLPRHPGAAAAREFTAPRTVKFTALSIMPGRVCCTAAQNQSKLRYLKDEAPSLPLRECDASRCLCAFAEHTDRRIARNSDRRMGIGLQSELYGSQGEPERRKRRGRRATDRFKRSLDVADAAIQ